MLLKWLASRPFDQPFRARSKRKASGRLKVEPGSPLVKNTTKALLAFVDECKAVEWTIAPAPGGAPKSVYRDPVVGVFGPELLPPNFGDGERAVRAALQAHLTEMTKPIAGWSSRREDTADDVADATAPEPDEEEAA